MKIKKKTTANTVPFKTLKRGNVFSFNGLVFMCTDDLYSAGRTKLNIVCLDTGQAGLLFDDSLVIPHPEAELHINA